MGYRDGMSFNEWLAKGAVAHELRQVAAFTYRNHRGEVARRRVLPTSIRFAATEWHPEPQWLMDAWDLDRQAERAFAMRDMTEFEGPEMFRLVTPGQTRFS